MSPALSTPPETRMLTRKEIEARAQAVLQQANAAGTLPIDPVSLAQQHDITVHNAEFAQDNLSGMITKQSTGTIILVKGSDPASRKRFTIAHELAHHFLHLNQAAGSFVDNTINLFREQFSDHAPDADRAREIEANRFAAALLMPEPLMRREFAHNPDIDYLAWRFGVSEQAMGYRMAELGLR
ncbi:ImmA/IrrE family metallo-endopeptidase [Hymenobacter cellulosilyticus]|uniref:ImmA/IrrE family metallo-endopeptidase n=1 Tax=Hymenobacter cellulosilyticus TaxID=2932248 RepID=A0A8T9Q920_9BACT|nr:ImmA/IrrE family metallo-endopeptidase [Hymenobacter cellulosilyticus]UOQ74037.1 ImmA/IrrE family metallo-endopeptidase [Hymenobacter cellulosilyticus]